MKKIKGIVYGINITFVFTLTVVIVCVLKPAEAGICETIYNSLWFFALLGMVSVLYLLFAAIGRSVILNGWEYIIFIIVLLLQILTALMLYIVYHETVHKR